MDVAQTPKRGAGALFATIWQTIKAYCTPLEVVSDRGMRYYTMGLAALLLLAWTFVHLPFIPTLGEVLQAFAVLWKSRGLAFELWTSLKMNILALVVSSTFAFGFAYLSTIPAIRPIARWMTKLRFLGFTGLVFLFSLYIGTGYKLRFSLMLFAICWFYLAAMVTLIRSIKEDRYEYAYSLGFSRWRTLWEIVIIGSLHDGLLILVQFAAYGWAMLTAVEGLSRSSGGVGVMILNNDKQMNIPEIFAIVLCILIGGIILDFILVAIIKKVCGYAYVNTQRRS